VVSINSSRATITKISIAYNPTNTMILSVTILDVSKSYTFCSVSEYNLTVYWIVLLCIKFLPRNLKQLIISLCWVHSHSLFVRILYASLLWIWSWC
jgi:hypothetical protein